MNAADHANTPPQWTAESFSEPVESSVLDLGYEVAFPFLAASADDFEPR